MIQNFSTDIVRGVRDKYEVWTNDTQRRFTSTKKAMRRLEKQMLAIVMVIMIIVIIMIRIMIRKMIMIIITMSRFTLTKKAMRRLEKQMLASSRLVVLSCTNITVNIKINIITVIITFIILILSIILMVTCKWSWFLTELTTIKLPKIPTTEEKNVISIFKYPLNLKARLRCLHLKSSLLEAESWREGGKTNKALRHLDSRLRSRDFCLSPWLTLPTNKQTK